MAKRFTDTEKWKKPFIRGMKAPYKLLWLYILDECDHAGVWQVDFDVAQIKIGEKLNKETALRCLKEKVTVFDNGEKWFIPEFIEFQYGVLNPDNRAHNSVIHILQKHNLIEGGTKPLTSPLQGAMDKDMDMDKDKDKDKYLGTVTIVEEGKPKTKQFIPPTVEEVIQYFIESGYTEESAKRAHKHYELGGWIDTKGHKVLAWKQKMFSVWFKDQNKIQAAPQKQMVD
jgi:hypothetical protein